VRVLTNVERRIERKRTPTREQHDELHKTDGKKFVLLLASP